MSGPKSGGDDRDVRQNKIESTDAAPEEKARGITISTAHVENPYQVDSNQTAQIIERTDIQSRNPGKKLRSEPVLFSKPEYKPVKSLMYTAALGQDHESFTEAIQQTKLLLSAERVVGDRKLTIADFKQELKTIIREAQAREHEIGDDVIRDKMKSTTQELRNDGENTVANWLESQRDIRYPLSHQQKPLTPSS